MYYVKNKTIMMAWLGSAEIAIASPTVVFMLSEKDEEVTLLKHGELERCRDYAEKAILLGDSLVVIPLSDLTENSETQLALLHFFMGWTLNTLAFQLVAAYVNHDTAAIQKAIKEIEKQVAISA